MSSSVGSVTRATPQSPMKQLAKQNLHSAEPHSVLNTSRQVGMTFSWRCWVPLLLMLMLTVSTAQQVPAAEVSALSALYNSTRGDSWLWRSERSAGPVWNFTLDAGGNYADNPCSSATTSTTRERWQGVTCSQNPQVCSFQTCHVTGITLPFYGMSGSIPPDISDLSHLAILLLDVNQLTGYIPPEVGDLPVLTAFSVHDNKLSGTIPPNLGRLEVLTYLALHTNDLTGPIPNELCNLTALVTLYIGDSYVTGTVPSAVGKLTALQNLALYSTPLTGTIPSELGQLTGLVQLALYSTDINGTIPNSVGSFAALELLNLLDNRLTGTIPSEIWECTTIDKIYLDHNQLTGSLSSNIGQLTALSILHLYVNRLTGTIPSEVSQLTALQQFYLSENQLTGSIPSSLEQIKGLLQIIFHYNQLTGTIPSSFEQLTSLELLYLYDNLLTGSIPSEVGQLTALQQISCVSNHLTGVIPSSIGQIQGLELLYLNDNFLTGTLPSTVGNLTNMGELWLHNNYFGGTLPAEMSLMKKLNILFLQNNLFTGHTSGSFNHSIQVELNNVDISNNLLSGSLSADIFLLPQLRVLSLSVNCFEEELPQSMCNAVEVEVLSLNGLGAAEGCSDMTLMPLSGVGLFNTIGGTVPSCVWALRNLSVLHLTGNGLSGELVRSLPVGSQIVDLSLSHNQLSGTIPLDIMNIASLDLSYNRFGGECQARTQYRPDSIINLEINRLSGQLPVPGLELVSNGSLSILRGNLFSCNTIPENDNFSSDYVCGSWNFNQSLILFVALFGVAVLIVVIVVSAYYCGEVKHRLLVALQSLGFLVVTYMTYLKNVDPFSLKDASAVQKIARLSGDFVEIMHYAARLLGVILLGNFALYLVKFLDSRNVYATHSHRYFWFWTMAYTRGEVPAGLLLMLWAGAISTCFYCIIIYPTKNDNSSKKTPVAAEHDVMDKTESFSKVVASVGLAFVFNACVMITVNTMYIYSTQQALSASLHFGIQISLSIFRLAYIAVAFPFLSQSISSAVANVRFRFILLTINNLLIPCIVTALTSDACFQGLLIPADSVITPYSYRSCLRYTVSNSGEVLCTLYDTVDVESAPMVPPFTYNSQCGSVVLTSYIPVLLLGYSIQLLLPFVLLAIVTCVSHDSVPASIRTTLHGVIWPEYWLQGGGVLAHNKAVVRDNPSTMLNMSTIFCNDVFNNLLVMLTFGLCSPLLAVAVACSVMLKMSLWVLLIGRYAICVSNFDAPADKINVVLSSKTNTTDGSSASHEIVESNTISPLQFSATTTSTCARSGDSSNGDVNKDDIVHFALVALAEVHISLFEVLAGSFWRLIWCSALFIALVGWDMATDDVGWAQSLWVPLFPLGFVLVLRCVAHCYVTSKEEEKRGKMTKRLLAVPSQHPREEGSGLHAGLPEAQRSSVNEQADVNTNVDSTL